MRRRPNNRAFTLTELLVLLMLFGVASLLSARLFTSSMQVIASAPQSQTHFAAIDRIAAQLRRDVWGAVKIDVPDPHTLVLTQQDQTSVRWQLSDEGITRVTSSGEQRWPVKMPMTFAQHGAAVVLQNDSGEQLRFVDQFLVASGEAR
jgi:type II secretory pathway pseudopilin PulG